MSLSVLDCAVEGGYRKTAHGSLPDIDIDFDNEKRPDVKAYLERRYNHGDMQRVFSVGTFAQEKIRSAIKDVCRVHRVSPATANYITAIIDDGADWGELMRIASSEKKVHDFIQKHPEVFEELMPLMMQPRTAGIHASALVITPEIIKGGKVNCYDILPIKKMNDMLVSEISGTDVDSVGLLKNDVLGIAELSRMSDMMSICNREYGTNLSIENILNEDLNDPMVYSAMRKGLTQGVFQLSSDGITRFVKSMRPDNINDLIASVALFRPGPLESGSAQGYVDCKTGMAEPQYLWGTYEILKDTYGYCIYQEQISKVAQKIGGLTLGDGVNLVKALSKKKIEKVRKFQAKFFEGAQKNGCPKDVADKIWEVVEAGASYAFNKSHATAYGLTAFIGAWIKVHYPIAFFTVSLKWVDKEKLPTIMNEMREIGNVSLVQPDINISGMNFETDYNTNTIYWSLIRIHQLGAKAVQYILRDRNAFGEYTSMENFIHRIFKYKLKQYKYFNDPDNYEENEKCPVNARHIKNLVYAGAFDKLENVQSPTERFGVMKNAAKLLGFEVSEKDLPLDMVDKHWWWSQMQIDIAGIGAIDYKSVYYTSPHPKDSKYGYKEFRDLLAMTVGTTTNALVCATIAEVSEKTYIDKREGGRKRFGKVILRQNTDIMQLVMWNDSWEDHKDVFWQNAGRIVSLYVQVKYSDYDEKNVLQLNKGAFATLV